MARSGSKTIPTPGPSQVPWLQATEGHYLIMPPVGPWQSPPGSRARKLEDLVRVEVVEVLARNRLTAKSGPEAARR